MKIITILFILLLTFLNFSFAYAHNPFTTKPENQHEAPVPVFNNKLFQKIIVWQHKLKEKMSLLVREAESSGSIRPLLFLILAAFAYGVIHAVGPGHGKAISLSYVLSQRPSYIQGMLFSNCMALFHGLSGIVFVLVIRLVLKINVIKNLETVTNITQVISYSIVACFGMGIVMHSIHKLIKTYNNKQYSYKKLKPGKYNNTIILSLVARLPAIGLQIFLYHIQ